MKRYKRTKFLRRHKSLPTRERGLKRVGRENLNEDITVAPYAGAWIETRICPCPRPAITVAPYAGAWIETVKLVQTEAVMTVAPYAGAWIETGGACPRFFSSLGSLPTRERGLKHYKHLIMIGRAKSLPTRERGLKPPTVAHPSGTRQRRSLRGSVD